jgi:hypothetical protein
VMTLGSMLTMLQKIDAMTKNQVRGFGRIQMCGALHVIWSAADGVRGQYVISLLYKDMLCLAWAGKVDQIYTIMLCVNLNDARVDTANNDHGTSRFLRSRCGPC